jgi:hypothetical protein
MVAGTIFSVLLISERTSSLGSCTFTIPIFGSMVQKGKLAASAAYDLVRALKRVDLPTFGSQTIQIFIGQNKDKNKG